MWSAFGSWQKNMQVRRYLFYFNAWVLQINDCMAVQFPWFFITRVGNNLSLSSGLLKQDGNELNSLFKSKWLHFTGTNISYFYISGINF